MTTYDPFSPFKKNDPYFTYLYAVFILVLFLLLNLFLKRVYKAAPIYQQNKKKTQT